MNLFLRHDLFKNIVTIDGQKYDVSDEQKEGYEAYQATDGSTKYRKLVGQGAPSETPEKKQAGDTGEAAAPKKEEPKNLDPLKAGQEQQQQASQQKPSLAEAKKLQETAKPPEEGVYETDEGGLSPFKPTPYTMDAEAHKDTTPMEHYHAANLADKLGDKKMAQFHREQAQKKTLEGDSNLEQDVSNQLREAGYSEDEKAHNDQFYDRHERGADIEQLRQLRREDDLKDGAPKTLGEMNADEKGAALDEVAERTGIKDITDKVLADEKHAELKEKFNSTKDKLDTARKEAQEKVTKEFEEKSKEYEEAKNAHESESSAYEAALEERAYKQAELKDKLQATTQKLKDLKEGKPVRDDSEERGHKDKYNETAKKLREHMRNAPSDEKVQEHTKKLQELKNSEKAKIKSVQEEHKTKIAAAQEAHEKAVQEHSKTAESLKGEYDKAVSEHSKTAASLKKEYEQAKSKAPARPKDKEQQAAYESAMQDYKKTVDAAKKKLDDHNANKKTIESAKKKLDDHKSKAPDKSKLTKLKADLSSKLDKMKSESDKKVSAAKAQVDTIKESHKAKVKEHQDTANKLSAEASKHKEAAGKAKAASEAAHAKQLEKWKASVSETKAEADKIKSQKSEVSSSKVDKPKTKEPKQTHVKPSTREEKMAHQDHTTAAKKYAENLKSHIQNRTDLSPEAKERLTDLYSQAEELAAQEHVPTKEDRKMLRDLQSRAKEHGGHESFDEKQARETEQREKEEAKQTAKQVAEHKKKWAQEDREAARKPKKPENEIEEAKLSEHKTQMKEKADSLREYMDSADLSDEERVHVQNAIDHYEQESQRDTLPGKDDAAKTKQLDQAVSRHNKEASKLAKEEAKAPAAPKEAPAASSGGSSSSRRSATSMLQAWNRGGAFGAKIARTAYTPASAGELTNMVDYAGGGAIRIGHALLAPRGKK